MRFVSSLATAFTLTLTSCSFSPKENPPLTDVPPDFKEGIGWKIAEPADAQPRGNWWAPFHDPTLDQILTAVDTSNQELVASAARAEQTAALMKAAKFAFFPTFGSNGSITRSKSGSVGGSTNSNSISSQGGGAGSVRDIQSLSMTSTWEIDLWGRLLHGAKGAKADLQAAEADVVSTRLSLQSQAAQNYFLLRAADAQAQLLSREVASYEKSLRLTKNRQEQGIASSADVAQAETQLATTRAALIEIGVQRATLEHALANLTGRAPASFDLRQAGLTAKIPALPAATPSTLLQRRPDIAAAERRVAAANQRIGAAKAAFFPTLVLSADNGWRGIADLFASSNNFWSLGADAAWQLVDQGSRIAAKAQADAIWKETVANYRQTVLTGLQEAEDAIATMRILAAEAQAQDEAVRAARENERIANNQYEAGTLSYLNVVTAQAAALTAERAAIDIRVRRLNATVGLITALGGSWDVAPVEVKPAPVIAP